MPATIMSPFHILPAYRAYRRNNQGKTFFPNWWIRDWSCAVTGWYSTNEPNGIIGPLSGSPKRLSYGVFPCFADRHSTPWNLPTNFWSMPDCNDTADVPSFTLRAALASMPFVSDRRCVEVPWFHDKTSQALPNSIELSVSMTLGFLSENDVFCGMTRSCGMCRSDLWQVRQHVRHDAVGWQVVLETLQCAILSHACSREWVTVLVHCVLWCAVRAQMCRASWVFCLQNTVTGKPGASSKSENSGNPKAERREWPHNLHISPATVPRTDAVFSIVRKNFEREPADPMEDLDVNAAVWGIFPNTTLQAAVHLGQDHEASLRYVKNNLWNSVEQLFNEPGKLISEQTEITGVTTIKSKDLYVDVDKLIVWKGLSDQQRQSLRLLRLCALRCEKWEMILLQPGRAKSNGIRKTITSRIWIESTARRRTSRGKYLQDSQRWASSRRFKTGGKTYSVNLSSSTTGSSSCQCTTTLHVEKKEIQKGVNKIQR